MDRACAGLSAEQIYARLHDDDGDAAAPAAGRRSALDDGDGDDTPDEDGDDGSGVLVEPGLDLKDPNDPWALALRPPDHPDEEQLRDVVAQLRNVVAQLRNDALSRLQGRAAARSRSACRSSAAAVPTSAPFSTGWKSRPRPPTQRTAHWSLPPTATAPSLQPRRPAL
jgi:hypothetical protein